VVKSVKTKTKAKTVTKKAPVKVGKKTDTDKVLAIIKRSLESGEDVAINGFGKFCVKEKHERLARNPATGEDMMSKPRRVVTFNCFYRLRDRINGKRH